MADEANWACTVIINVLVDAMVGIGTGGTLLTWWPFRVGTNVQCWDISYINAKIKIIVNKNRKTATTSDVLFGCAQVFLQNI